MDRAVQVAKRVHESGVLRDLRPIERGRMVRKMGDYLLQHIDEIGIYCGVPQSLECFRVARKVLEEENQI